MLGCVEPLPRMNKMNDRIKELAEQALFESDFDDEQNIKITLDIFAELIVKECADIVEGLSPGYDDYRNQIEDAFRRDCVEKIKEHFGVEE